MQWTMQWIVKLSPEGKCTALNATDDMHYLFIELI